MKAAKPVLNQFFLVYKKRVEEVNAALLWQQILLQIDFFLP